MSRDLKKEKRPKSWGDNISKAKKGCKFTKEHKRKLAEAHMGHLNANHCPFILHVELPCGEIENYYFNGETPYRDCVKMFGIPPTVQALLKKGGEFVIKRRLNRTRHHWPEQTKLTMSLV